MDNDRKALSLELDRFRTDVGDKFGTAADAIKNSAIDRLLEREQKAVEAVVTKVLEQLKAVPQTVKFSEDGKQYVVSVVFVSAIDQALATYKGDKQ